MTPRYDRIDEAACGRIHAGRSRCPKAAVQYWLQAVGTGRSGVLPLLSITNLITIGRTSRLERQHPGDPEALGNGLNGARQSQAADRAKDHVLRC